MSDAIKNQTTIEKLEYLYNKMINAYNLFEAEEDPKRRESLKLYYKTQVDNYRDVCTTVVERLMSTKPDILEAIQIPYVY